MMNQVITFLLLMTACLNGANAQIIGDSGYLLGDYIEIGIGPKGTEGAESIDGDHARFGEDHLLLGIVANPQMDDWEEYNGDYFLPGTPQNGFGLQIDGVNYNNAYSGGAPGIVGEIVSYSDEGDCMTLEWEGEVEGVIVNVKYKLIKAALFYTVEMTLTNTNPVTLNNVYYLRTIEPDNNFELIGPPTGYNTTNTIVSQSGPLCKKALVTAEQTMPWDSYIGFCAIGDNFRCSRGGFIVNNGSFVWNGTGGQTIDVGDGFEADQAISLAYKIASFEAGASETFEFATVFTEASVGDAINNLFKISYDAGEGTGTGDCNHLVDTVRVGCEGGNDITLSIEGPNTSSYNWIWSPAIDLDGTSGASVVSTPTDTIVYTVTGTPTVDCLEHPITKTIVVIPIGIPPSIFITDPGYQCEEFDLATLAFVDENEIPLTVNRFFTEIPTSADQIEPLFEGDILSYGDDVYLMIGDTISGCFDWAKVVIDFADSIYAGRDSIITVCANPDSILHITDLIDAEADLGGVLTENTFSEQFDAETGDFELTGLEGVFTFDYVLLAIAPCPNDTATFTVIVNPIPDITISDDVTMASGETTTLTSGGGVMYSWMPITGLSDPTSSTTEASPTETTTYTLTVTDENGCVNFSEVTITINGHIGFPEWNKNGITLYPNPFSDFTMIQFENSQQGQYLIVVTDMLGRVVYRKENNMDTTVKISKEELGTGAFLITIFDLNNNDQIFTEKLLVE